MNKTPLIIIALLLSISTTTAYTTLYANDTAVIGSAWSTMFPYNNFNNSGHTYLEHNITINATTAAAGSSFKFYWDSTQTSAGGEEVYTEWQTTDYSIKYEPTYDRTISGVAAGTFTINIRINYTADTFVMCVNGANCQAAKAFTDNQLGFAAITFGGDGPKVNVTKYTVDGETTTSCTYSGTGNWTILKSDNCTIVTSNDLLNNTLIFDGSGVGNTTINGLITNVSRITWTGAPNVILGWNGSIRKLT